MLLKREQFVGSDVANIAPCIDGVWTFVMSYEKLLDNNVTESAHPDNFLA